MRDPRPAVCGDWRRLEKRGGGRGGSRAVLSEPSRQEVIFLLTQSSVFFSQAWIGTSPFYHSCQCVMAKNYSLKEFFGSQRSLKSSGQEVDLARGDGLKS